MKTQDTAINYIYAVLTDATGVTCPVYRYTKPTRLTPDEFVVLNALPISEGVMQQLFVNVNYYVKDLSDGIPDIETLECRTATLMSLLTEIHVKSYHIDFETQEYHRQSNINYHFSNVRLNVKLIND